MTGACSGMNARLRCREGNQGMPNLTDYIEDYLKKLLAISNRRYVDIHRHELARKFSCVPSQINYVLGSRFSLERGYLVESRRGGSGYIRIYRVEPLDTESYVELLEDLAESGYEPSRIRQLLVRLTEEKKFTRREARMVESVLNAVDNTASEFDKNQIRELQARLFKSALEALLKGSE